MIDFILGYIFPLVFACLMLAYLIKEIPAYFNRIGMILAIIFSIFPLFNFLAGAVWIIIWLSRTQSGQNVVLWMATPLDKK